MPGQVGVACTCAAVCARVRACVSRGGRRTLTPLAIRFVKTRDQGLGSRAFTLLIPSMRSHGSASDRTGGSGVPNTT